MSSPFLTARSERLPSLHLGASAAQALHRLRRLTVASRDGGITTEVIRATIDEPDLSVGIALSIQTHGSLVNWHPHVHALVTNGGFRPDGTFVQLPFHTLDVLTEAFRRAVLKLFVDLELFEPDVAESMLAWMHSGFSVNDSVWLDQDDAPAHRRLARYCARNPVSLDRMAYDADAGSVTYSSDKPSGPTAGCHTFDALDFVALVAAQIPDKGQVLQRYYGYYSSRARGMRRKAAQAAALPVGSPEVPLGLPEDVSMPAACRRWADLLRRIFEIDPLLCPSCGGNMRIVDFVVVPRDIDRILCHMRDKGRDPRAGPWAVPAAGSSSA